MVELLGNESVKISNTKPPTEDPCTEDAVQLTAKELNQMSMQEREQILYDVHGISEKAFDETPDFLARKLKEFQKVLDTTRHNTAYDLALRTNPDFVTNQKFRLAFLRTDQFNADKAVNRWIRHFEAKLDLFGEALLCKHIEQDDLDQETLKCLYSGWQQDLPLRDVSGRLVTILFTKLRDENMPVLQKLRRCFYASMALWEDEETQRNGRVLILWGSDKRMDRVATWRIARLASCLPFHFNAFHVCFQPEHSKVIRPMVALAQFAAASFYRLRVRTHTGTLMELKFTLQTFGIPAATLPIENDGELLMDLHRDRWARRRREERMRSFVVLEDGPSTKTIVRVDTPKNSDVLLGRERVAQQHLGNFGFRYLIDEYRARYEQANRKEKTTLANEIVGVVQSRKGRFLQKDETGWVEVDDIVARQKVSSCFRSFRKQEQRAEKGN